MYCFILSNLLLCLALLVLLLSLCTTIFHPLLSNLLAPLFSTSFLSTRLHSVPLHASIITPLAWNKMSPSRKPKKSIAEFTSYITWCSWSIVILSCGIFTVIKTGYIYKYFIKGSKSCLNSYPLSNTNFRGCGYLNIHLLLNNLLTLADDLSIYSSFPHMDSYSSKFVMYKI